ncbi:hypothetical protein [Natribacillus halophilus]|uniref:Uncharacterized protein n=1 Tax=Natribacillus halophilus TaxID=549003 RepID=A0A1G8KIU7_9BACI|nr:hypothetical protein [Natribacillus halophilus]SDI43332.1 hypothetical protein SAMN04488123_102130 [Natribacillus halophilus]
MIFLDDRYEVGVFESLGDHDVKILVGNTRYTIELDPADKAALEQHLINQENLLIPFDTQTKKMVLDVGQNYHEADMEELIEAADRGWDDGENETP